MSRAGPRPTAFTRELSERDLKPGDVIGADEIFRLVGIPHSKTGTRALHLSLGLSTRLPKALFIIGVRSYWSRREVMSWLRPFLNSDRPAVRRDTIREEAVRRYTDGDDVEAIAADYGLTVSAVYQWVRAAGVLRPKPLGRPQKERSGAKIDMAVELYAKGMDGWRASRLAGMDDRAFLALVEDRGGKVRAAHRRQGWRKHPPEVRREGVLMYHAGMTLAEVAERFGAYPSTVRRWLDEAGEPTR